MRFYKLYRLSKSFFRCVWLNIKSNNIPFTTEICKDSLLYNCKIGHHTYIGLNCIMNNVVMGNYCSIASHVQIGGMEHATFDISTSTWLSNNGDDYTKTYIGNDVWIAANSIIKLGVTIGDGAVIGANSFVNKDVPPYAIVAGSPAKIIRYRFSEEKINTITKSGYYKMSPSKAKETIKKIIDYEK